jgi:hypothetical protein
MRQLRLAIALLAATVLAHGRRCRAAEGRGAGMVDPLVVALSRSRARWRMHSIAGSVDIRLQAVSGRRQTGARGKSSAGRALPAGQGSLVIGPLWILLRTPRHDHQSVVRQGPLQLQRYGAGSVHPHVDFIP